jgi:hypothetical protein
MYGERGRNVVGPPCMVSGMPITSQNPGFNPLLNYERLDELYVLTAVREKTGNTFANDNIKGHTRYVY